MQVWTNSRETKLRARWGGVSRFGTLCGVLGILALTVLPGCPGVTGIADGDVGGACLADGTCTDNGNFCDGAETCDANNICGSAGSPCPEGETCNEDADRCENCAAGDACDDGNVCTTDTCSDAGRCENVDPGCDDGDACTENDACDPAGEAGNCAGTAVACNAGEECDPADGSCVAAGCTDDVDCDDENLCTDNACTDGACVFTAADCDDGDACTDDSCDGATGDCVNTAMVCDVAGEECVDGTCVEAGFRVSIDNCPENLAAGGSMSTLTATVAGGSADGQVTYAWSATAGSFDDATSATPVYTLPNSGSAVVSLTVTDNAVTAGTDAVVSTDACTTDADCATAGDTCNADGFCETPGTADVLTPGDTASADCDSVDVEFTAEIICNAGTVAARRTAVGGFVAIALAGSASQSGVDNTVGTLVPTWSVVSQPAGSGTVTFSNANILGPTFTVGAQGVAGLYTLQLDVVNNDTSQTCNSMVTMEVLDAPILQCPATAIARRNVEHGAMVTIQVEYNVSESTTFSIYAKETAANNAVNQVLLATVGPVAGTAGALVSMDVVIDTALLPTGAGSYLLGWDAIDSVGLFNGGGGPPPATLALAKAVADEAIVGRRQCVLYVGRNPQQGSLAAVETTAATAANPAEPAGLTAATEIGTPVSVGTGNTAAAFNAGNVQYPGVGDTAGPRTLTHIAGTANLGFDVNGDGLNDIAVANGNNIQVLFGAVDTLTDNNAGATTPIGLGAAAGAAAAVGATANQDWGTPGAFVANERSQFAVTGAALVSLNCADYNNDNQVDFSYTADTAAAGAFGDAGLVFLAGNATNADPFVNAIELIYTSAGAANEVGSGVSAGDFNGDGRMDAGFGFPNNDVNAAGAGAVYIVYGQIDSSTTLGSGFPVAGALEATFATSANGYAFHGTGVADLCGGSLLLADITGGDSADAIFEQRLVAAAAASGRIGIVAGSANTDQPDDNASFSITDQTAADFVGVQFAAGDLTAGTKNDLAVAAPAFESGTAAGAEGALFVVPSTSLGNGNITALSGVFSVVNNRVGVGANQLALGGAVGVFDYNGDGNMDVLTAHNAAANNTVYVLNGPLQGTGANFNNTQNGFNFRIETATAFTQIGWGDVNGDGVGDTGLFATNVGVVLNGLER